MYFCSRDKQDFIFFFLDDKQYIMFTQGQTIVSSVTNKLYSKHETQQPGVSNILLQSIYHNEKQG